MLYVYSVTTPTALGLVKSDGTRSDMNYISGQHAIPMRRRQRDGDVPAARLLRPAAAKPTPGVAAPALVNHALAAARRRWRRADGHGPAADQAAHGRITAFDMNKGDIGECTARRPTTSRIIRRSKASRSRRRANGRIGTLVTKTSLVAGEGGFFTTPNGQRGAMLRVYDKGTGNEVGSVYSRRRRAAAMTYMLNGKQHIVLAISGGSYTAELVAYRLP
jgi:quinoprotein glucose dehydrogenase